MSYSKEEIEEQNSKIIQLYRQRKRRQYIANELGLPITTVQGRIQTLIKEGRIISIRSRNIRNKKKNSVQSKTNKQINKFENLSNEELNNLAMCYIKSKKYKKVLELLDYYAKDEILSEEKQKTIARIKSIIQERIDTREMER